MGPTLALTDASVRIGAATVLGALIGLERERLERAAGLRTHALVALASSLMMIVSTYGFADVLVAGQPTVLDPSRIAAQVVSGVGFLGAGVIIFRKNTVRGLTTAASVWTVAGIGLACGGGLLGIAVVGTLAVLLLQAIVRPLERRFFEHHAEPHHLVLRMPRSAGAWSALDDALRRASIEPRTMHFRPVKSGDANRVELDLGGISRQQVTAFLERVDTAGGIDVLEYTLMSRRALLRQDDAEETVKD